MAHNAAITDSQSAASSPRCTIASRNATCLPRQGPAKLERHGEHTPARVIVRVLQRILALTALVWHNDRTGGPVADHGKALPTELTDAGRVQLHAASVAVRTIEKQMLAPLTPSAQQRLLADLAACAAALTGNLAPHRTSTQSATDPKNPTPPSRHERPRQPVRRQSRGGPETPKIGQSNALAGAALGQDLSEPVLQQTG